MSTELEVIDAEPVEHLPAPATLFHTDDPVEVLEKATRVANALKDVLKRQGMLSVIQGKEHVGVEGWQTLGSMLGVTAVVTHTEAVEGGFKAHVEARTLDGRVVGAADAMCTRTEKRGPWKSADDYARLSMAQTRATSKALKGPLGFIVKIAGFETTPMEEMTFVDAEPAPEPISDDHATVLTDRAKELVEQGAVTKQTILMRLRGLGDREAPSISAGIEALSLSAAKTLEVDFANWGAA